MFTSVGDHGMVPLLVPGVFPPVGFPCKRACSSETHGTIPTSLLVFCGKHSYFTCFFAFSGVQAALWHMQPCTEEEAVLTTILYMPFDMIRVHRCVRHDDNRDS